MTRDEIEKMRYAIGAAFWYGTHNSNDRATFEQKERAAQHITDAYAPLPEPEPKIFIVEDGVDMRVYRGRVQFRYHPGNAWQETRAQLGDVKRLLADHERQEAERNA